MPNQLLKVGDSDEEDDAHDDEEDDDDGMRDSMVFTAYQSK